MTDSAAVPQHKVTRLSGRVGSKERVLYQGDDWQKAHAIYEREAIALRCGEVRKYVCGTIACSQRSYNLRSKW